jgi:hypothetical protein
MCVTEIITAWLYSTEFLMKMCTREQYFCSYWNGKERETDMKNGMQSFLRALEQSALGYYSLKSSERQG